MLNWALVKHPVNWITIFLMVFIGTMVLNLILAPWHVAPLNNGSLSSTSTPLPDLQWMQ